VNNRRQKSTTAVMMLVPLKVQLMQFFTCTGTASHFIVLQSFLSCLKWCRCAVRKTQNL